MVNYAASHCQTCLLIFEDQLLNRQLVLHSLSTGSTIKFLCTSIAVYLAVVEEALFHKRCGKVYESFTPTIIPP